MINNLEQIKKLLSFNSQDDFYHIQIIKRKKEHKELGSNSMIIKTYYLKSLDNLDKIFPEIKSLCDFHNARGCINLNKRSFEKIAYHLLQKIASQISNRDFKSCKDAYNSVCGAYSSETEKKWIIDVDERNGFAGELAFIAEIIKQCKPNKGENKCYDALETKNGYHIITKPFNVQEANLKYDIHKDNPTILYIP